MMPEERFFKRFDGATKWQDSIIQPWSLYFKKFNVRAWRACGGQNNLKRVSSLLPNVILELTFSVW